MPTILINPAGQSIPQVEKFAQDSIVYTLDCTKLLDTNELILSVVPKPTTTNVVLSDIRTRRGNSIEVRVSNTPLSTEAYIDIPITILFTTTSTSTRSAVFKVRVYK